MYSVFFQLYHACSVRKGQNTVKTQACPNDGPCMLGPFNIETNGTKVEATYCSGLALAQRRNFDPMLFLVSEEFVSGKLNLANIILSIAISL